MPQRMQVRTRPSRGAVVALLSTAVLAVSAAPALASRTPGPVSPSFTLGPGGEAAQVPGALADSVGGMNKLCTGDFNGDGNQDVAAAFALQTGGSSGVSVAFGDGSGRLGSWTRILTTPGSPASGRASCAVGDFNGDGISDLVAVGSESPEVTIALGNTNGTFTISRLSDGPSSDATTVAVGDFNGDGKADLAVGLKEGKVAILLGNGAGGFSPAPGSPYAVTGEPLELFTADLTNNGRSDVLVTKKEGVNDYHPATLLANPNGSLQTATQLPWNESRMAVGGDINGDGLKDVIYPGSGYAVFTAFGEGDGGFNDPAQTCAECWPVSTLAPAWKVIESLALGDFNNDGILDAAVGDSETSENHETDVWTGTGTGASGEEEPMFDQTAQRDQIAKGPFVLISSIAANVTALAPVDMNDDGRLDIVAAADGRVGVLLNNTPVPSVTTGEASSIGGEHATVAGTVGSSGLSTAYGVQLLSEAGAVQSSQAAPSSLAGGSGTEPVSVTLAGLSPQTTYRYRVYATNANGTTVGQIKTLKTTIAGPANMSPPQIAGTAQPGQTLQCQTGGWSGSPTFAYQWLRGGVALDGQTASEYGVMSADVGGALSCVVTATNAGGSASAESPSIVAVATVVPTATVVPPAATVVAPGNVTSLESLPGNLGAPGIFGTAAVGQTLACAAGSWSAGATFTYAWLREGQPIAGATTAAYKIASADAGHALACRVTASNAVGAGSADSPSVQVPKVAAAARCVVPKLRGLTVKAAERKLKAARCKTGRVVKAAGKGVRPGRVLKSKPGRGARKPAGTKVQLVERR